MISSEGFRTCRHIDKRTYNRDASLRYRVDTLARLATLMPTSVTPDRYSLLVAGNYTFITSTGDTAGSSRLCVPYPTTQTQTNSHISIPTYSCMQ